MIPEIMYKDGVDLSSYFHVEEIRRPLLPPISTNTINVPGRHGALLGKSRFESFNLETDIAIMERDPQTFRARVREIAPLLHQAGEISFYDEPDLYYKAKLNGNTAFDKIDMRGEGTLTWLIYDPFAYGKTITKTLLQAENTILLMPFMPTVIPDSSAGRIVTEGTIYALPVITVVFQEAADDFRITLNDDRYVRIERDFEAGDTLVIDCVKEVVTVNNARRMNDLTIESRFFQLEEGENHLIASSANMAEIQVAYQPRYL